MKVRCAPVILTAILLLIPHFAGHAETGASQFSDPGKLITVESEQIFVITLESNRTTGYEWQIAGKLDTYAVELVGVEYVRGAGTMPGSGGRENWTFRAITSRRESVPIRFQYVRPWEKDAKPVKEVVFSVAINKGPVERQIERMQRAMDERHRESFNTKMDE